MIEKNLSTAAGEPEARTVPQKRLFSTRFPDWLRSRPIYQRWRGSRLRQAVEWARAFGWRNYFPLQILLILAYRLSLDFIYLTMVCRLFAYDRYYANMQPSFYGASLLATLVFAPFVTRLQEEGSPSSRIVVFLSYIYFIPLTSYCGCGGANVAFFLTGIAYWAMLLLFQFQLPVLVLSPLPLRHAQQAYLSLTILSSLFVMFISGRYTGFRFTLDFINVYEVRAEAAGYNMPVIFAYALSMMSIVLAILMLCWLDRKKYLTVLLLMVVYLFSFSIGAQKSYFFYLLLLLAGYFFYRPWMFRWLGGLLTLFCCAAVLEERIIGSFHLMNLFFRRSMFLVVRISRECMEFFQKNPVSLFRDSSLGKLPGITPLYTTGIPKIMGEFRGHIGEGANNGLLGDLFANFPVPMGIFLLPLLLVVCFRLLDATSYKLPEKLTISTCVYCAFTFANSSWGTVLLSHGFLMACLLFYFFPKEERLVL